MINVVMAREPIPTGSPSVFLAGPTPDKSNPVPSWRPAAIEALAAQWTGEEPLTILSPESRHGQRADRYEDQVDWETGARAAATAILFWIPRDMRTLPGMTTNVEFGLDVSSGRVVLGCPPDCANPERNRYPIYVARRHGVPVRETLHDAVTTALDLIVSAPVQAPEVIRYTADVVAITPDRRVLLIERGWDPYEGHWALPGGHGAPGETSRRAAVRELEEETGVRVAAEGLEQIGVFDAPGRDPRGRYVTVAYLAHVPADIRVTAGDDARVARWWPLDDLPPRLAFDHADILNAAMNPTL